MKVIDRHNILELIGKDRRKYHSAIITCYSYDFSFFEERVLTVLRTANIKNVNVFVDGKFLETTLEHTTGKEFRANKTYALTPVYPKGLFHPKIMLLVGQRQGLLIIGSGNLTGSGICSNDEIWGAFQLSSPECEHSGLFHSVWQYLLLLHSSAKGFVSQTLDWINKYSLWLQDLQPVKYNWIELNARQKAKFLFNSSSSNILSQLVHNLPRGKAESISIVSPFYDKDGELIRELKTQFRPKEFNCVIQREYGLLPYEFNDKSVKFYEWKDCFENAKRLHAKLFHFKYRNDEYLLFGSPNATTAAVGKMNSRAFNDECCLLLHRPFRKSYFEELGIKLQGRTISISNLKKGSSIEVVPGIKTKFKITYSELRDNRLSIYFNKFYIQDISIKIFDVDGLEVEKVKTKIKTNSAEIEISMTEQAFKICLYEKQERVSNFILIHRVEFLLKNNPDPRQEKLDELLEEILTSNADNITEIFNHVSYNWADEEDVHQTQNRLNNVKTRHEKKELRKEYEVLDEVKFNTISKQTLMKQQGILTSVNVRIADFLRTLGTELINQKKEDFEESEEAKQAMQSEGGEGKEINRKISIVSDGEREQKAVFKYLNKLHDSYNELLQPFYNSKGLDHPNNKVSIKSLSNLLIALEVYQIYYGKKFTTEAKAADGSVAIKEVEYISEGNYTSANCAKWFLCDIIGKFLLLSTDGHKAYDYDLLISKQTEMRKNAFTKSIFSVLNISWSEKYYAYRDSLLLNLLFYLNPATHLNSNWIERLKIQLQSLEEKSKRLAPNYQYNSNYFFNRLLPSFSKWLRLYNNEEMKKKLVFELNNIEIGDTVFKKGLGFAEIVKKYQIGEKYIISLKSTGLEFNEDDQQSVLHDIQVGTKIIKF